jgi:hypothetical protein
VEGDPMSPVQVQRRFEEWFYVHQQGQSESQARNTHDAFRVYEIKHPQNLSREYDTD